MKKIAYNLLLLLFFTVGTLSAATYNGTCGANLSWTLDTSTGLLQITGSGAMDDYEIRQAPWYSYYSSLKNVSFPSGLTTIGNGAFYNCTQLTGADIPEGVTRIGERAFESCSRMTSLTIPNSATSIGEKAFYTCKKLSEIVIPDGVNILGQYAFGNCQELASITIGNGVATIGEYAFQGCNALETVVMGNSITSIGQSAFNNTAIYLNTNNWVSGVLYIGDYLIKAQATQISSSYTIKNGTKLIADQAFWQCTNLTSVTIPNSVKYIGEMAFESCRMQSVSLDGVLSIDTRAFAFCSQLTTLELGSTLNYIDILAFTGCNALTSVTCMAVNPPALGTYDANGTYCGVFNGVNCATIPLYVPSESVTTYQTTDQWKDFNVQAISTAIPTIKSELNTDAKIIRDGNLYIIRDGNTYTPTGVQVK